MVNGSTCLGGDGTDCKDGYIIHCPRHSEANVKRLESTIEKLRDALGNYGTHDKECDCACISGWSPETGHHVRPYRGEEYHTKEYPKCSCGLSEVLKSAEGE